jgi:hypothetical protein
MQVSIICLENLKYKMKLIALANFSSCAMECTKLSSMFVVKFVIRLSFLIMSCVLGFGREVDTHFQNVISAGVEKRPFNFLLCAHLPSIVSVVNHEDA